MLHVCHLISGDLWARAEVMVYHLFKGLQAYDDLALSAILLNEGRLAEEIRKLGISVHVVDESKVSFLSILLKIRKILSSRPPDVIHSHRYKENILAYLISGSIPRPKLVGTQHGMSEIHGGETGLKHRLISQSNFFLLSRCFHRVVGVSQNIQDAFLKQYGFSENKMAVIHNGIEIPDTPVKKQNGGYLDFPHPARIQKGEIDMQISGDLVYTIVMFLGFVSSIILAYVAWKIIRNL